MSKNFWLSSHCNEWIFSNKKSLEKTNPHDRDWFTISELKRLRLYFVNYIRKLGASPGLSTSMRQRIIATAIVYFKRFYIQQSFVEFDPWLVAPTMLFIAAKVEEWPIHADHMIKAVKSIDERFSYSKKDMLECEFFCLELLRFDLIVFHPYRPLKEYYSCLKHQLDSNCFQSAWSICNDSYSTDVFLVYPPYAIAVACIYMAGTFHDQDVKDWIANLRMNKIPIFDVVAEILDYYDYKSQHDQQLDAALLKKLRSHTNHFHHSSDEPSKPSKDTHSVVSAMDTKDD